MNSFESFSKNSGDDEIMAEPMEPIMNPTSDERASAMERIEEVYNNEAERGAEKTLIELYQERGAKVKESYYNQLDSNDSEPDQLPSEPEVTQNGEDEETETLRREVVEKLKSNRGSVKPKTMIAIAAATVIAGAILTTVIVDKVNNKAPEAPSQPPSRQEERITDGEHIGIYDGYGEKGMYLSKNKTSDYAFASAVEVAEVCDGDECEMIKYTANNQVESMASYMALFPEKLQPEGFKGLTIAETEAKLESLSVEEYEEVQKQFNNVIDRAFTRTENAKGRFANVYMDKKDAKGGWNYQNMEAVKCYTDENDKYTTLYWTEDDNANSAEIGEMMVKITKDDNNEVTGVCIQPIVEVDNPVIKDIPEIPDKPTTPETTTTPTTTPPPETTTTPPPETTTTPPETTTKKPKDYDNMSRIDEQITNDIADDVNTDKIVITTNPGVSDSGKTDKPSSDVYTQPSTTQNNDSKGAETVTTTNPSNDYSGNRGGANPTSPNAVQDDDKAQSAADSRNDQAVTGGQALEDVLSDLGL